MGFDKVKIKQVRGLMILAAVLILALIYSEKIFEGIVLAVQIAGPFIIGGVIAFVLNLPMNLIEKKILGKWQGRIAGKLKRPLSMVLALIFVVVLIILVVLTVVPQLSKTIVVLGNKIPEFVEDAIDWLQVISKEYPQIEEEVKKLGELEIDWAQIGNSIFGFLKSGFGNVVTSTVSVASSIIGGLVNFVISLIFALYILSQKEKLENQGRRILSAYLPERACRMTEHVFALLYRNFSKFISGQCLEAVILGIMFIVAMTLFQMPYAVMVGVLIAFTALIPVVGAFIGCAVGTFLILIENPMQAFIFLIMFLVLQQLEGNLIYPKVVGNSVGLPSIWVLMAVSLGGSLFGVVGMLTFIPILSTAYILLKESVNARNARRLAGGKMSNGRTGGKPNNKAGIKNASSAHTDAEVKKMNKKKKEKQEAQKNHDQFNSVTQKVKPENQNQEHNVRKEGIQPINQKR